MSTYSLSQRTVSIAINTAAWEIRAPVAILKPKLMELGIISVSATASVVGLGRPAAIGLIPTTPVVVLDEQDGNGPVGQTSAAVAWGTGPTIPLQFLRRVSLAAAIGAGVIWTFPRGLGIPVGGALVLWNIAAGSALDVYAVFDE